MLTKQQKIELLESSVTHLKAYRKDIQARLTIMGKRMKIMEKCIKELKRDEEQGKSYYA